MTTNWKIVDGNGDLVISPDTIRAIADQQRKTPKQVAVRDARDMVNVDAGDDPVFAVPAGPTVIGV